MFLRRSGWLSPGARRNLGDWRGLYTDFGVRQDGDEVSALASASLLGGETPKVPGTVGTHRTP
jgi:hypothetical protein